MKKVIFLLKKLKICLLENATQFFKKSRKVSECRKFLLSKSLNLISKLTTKFCYLVKLSYFMISKTSGLVRSHVSSNVV